MVGEAAERHVRLLVGDVEVDVAQRVLPVARNHTDPVREPLEDRPEDLLARVDQGLDRPRHLEVDVRRLGRLIALLARMSTLSAFVMTSVGGSRDGDGQQKPAGHGDGAEPAKYM